MHIYIYIYIYIYIHLYALFELNHILIGFLFSENFKRTKYKNWNQFTHFELPI